MKNNYYTDYYPFGSPMPARSFSASSYRYGFNGKEKDDEVKGEGNSLDFGGRIYDSRLGRWSGLDPLRNMYPGMSPYSAFGNSPLYVSDRDGKLLTDPSGNIIYVNNGERKSIGTTVESNSKTGTRTTSQTFEQKISVFGNDGTRIEAFRFYKEVTVSETYEDFDTQGNTVIKTRSTTSIVSDVADDKYDCHGYTFAGGKILIESSQMEKLLESDGYKDAGDIGCAQEAGIVDKGTIVVYTAAIDLHYKDHPTIKAGEITHTAVGRSDGKLDSKNGTGGPKVTTTNLALTKLYKSYNDVYKKILDKVVGKEQGLKDKGSNSNGLRELSKKEEASLQKKGTIE